MKTFYVVSIKKDFTELTFQFGSFFDMSDFVKMVIESSDYEASIKKVELPFSESEVEE